MITNASDNIKHRIEIIRNQAHEISDQLIEGVDYYVIPSAADGSEQKVLSKAGAELIAQVMEFNCEGFDIKIEESTADGKTIKMIITTCQISTKNGGRALGQSAHSINNTDISKASQKAYTNSFIKGVISLAALSSVFKQEDDISDVKEININELMAHSESNNSNMTNYECPFSLL